MIVTFKPDEWLECPHCKEKPRLWIFDNGEYAKCKCQDTYDKAAASGISIWDYHKKHNGDMTEWNHDDLRDNWNAFVLSMTDTGLPDPLLSFCSKHSTTI